MMLYKNRNETTFGIIVKPSLWPIPNNYTADMRHLK